MKKLIIAILLLLFITLPIFSDNTNNISVNPVVVAIEKGSSDDEIAKLIIKLNNKSNEQSEDEQIILDAYNKLVQKYGVTDKYRKSYEEILRYLCFTASYSNKKVYDETEKLNLLESSYKDMSAKGGMCSFLSIESRHIDGSDPAKYLNKFNQISESLIKNHNKESQFEGYYLLANHYCSLNTDKATEYANKAYKIAETMKDDSKMSNIEGLRDMIKHNKEVMEKGTLRDTGINSPPRIITLCFIVFIGIFFIIIIISKIKKHSKPE